MKIPRFFSRISDFLRPSAFGFRPSTPANKSFSPGVDAWLRGETTDTGTTVLSSPYEQDVWVYRAINVLAEQVANIPFLFSHGERGRETLITSGPLLDFYSHPGHQLNRFHYWELRVMWLMLRGECFRIPIFEDAVRTHSTASQISGLSTLNSNNHQPRRKLKKVLILDPAQFQHIVENNELVAWRYTGFGPQAPLESQIFLPEEVWFEKLPNPFDFWRGLAPLYVAGTAARTDFAASAYMKGILENNADNGLIVRSDQQLDEEQRAQVLATVTNRKRKPGTADRPIFLWGVNEIVRPTLSSADLQYLENRKFSRAEICAAFGIPEEIVTHTDHAKYNSMDAARLNFIEHRVAPLCSRLEAEEEATVKAIDPKAVGWFDLDSLPIMQAARRDRLAAAKAGFDMGIPFNELNRLYDLGFKPLPWGNTGYLPSRLQKIGESGSSSSTSSSSK